jgi:hypothetical protein
MGRTPLSRAAEYGHDLIVKLLREMGKIKMDSNDRERRTPLSVKEQAVGQLLLEASGQAGVERHRDTLIESGGLVQSA